jgi:protein SCO1/2
MITVDPRRDTVDQVAEYVREFHPRLIGLTGTPQQIQEVSKLYRVYSATGYSEEQV